MLSQRVMEVSGWWLIAALCCLSLPGCGGEKLVTAKGTVTKDKQPIALGRSGYIEITLIPDVPPGTPLTTRPGRVDAAGNFEIQEVKPGKYKVAIELRDPTPADDKFQGEFSAKNTKIVREIDGKTPLNIDLSAP
jgi:hypothetical protein